MPYITVGKENSGDIELYYEDHGTGDPVILIHGWPLSGSSWERQVPALLNAGFRVIHYDRRGFGASSKPVSGYDYDTLSHDLHQIITELKLREFSLVGFSMGGGEVARYLGTYGCESVSKAVFISSIQPFLLQTDHNPEGVPSSVFEGIRKELAADRPAFLSKFLADFYNVDALGGKRISDQAVALSWNIAAGASPKATLDCVDSWLVDFRDDLNRIDIPTLVLHGDADRILPIAATGKRTATYVRGCKIEVVAGAPHGMLWTHADKVNSALLDFLGQTARSTKAA